MAAQPQLAPAPEPIDEAIVLVIEGQTHVVQADDPAWPIAFHARERDQQLKLAERDLRGKRALIEKLRTDEKAKAEQERKKHPDRALIEEAFDKWRTLSGHKNCKLTPERFDMTAARLVEDYEPAFVLMAAVGVALNPYIIEGERKDSYKAAMSTGEKLEDHANRCPAAARLDIKTRFDSQLALV